MPFKDVGMTTIVSQSVGSTDHIPFDRIKKNLVILASFVYHTAMLNEQQPRKGKNE